MRDAPLGIQRAMIRRNALVSALTIVMVVALAGYIPFSLFVLVGVYMGIIYLHVLSATAKRLKALKKSRAIRTTYASSIERFVENLVLIGLPLFALVMFGLHWLTNLSAGPLLAAFYPGLIGLATLVTIYFYLAQLPKVMASQRIQAIFS